MNKYLYCWFVVFITASFSTAQTVGISRPDTAVSLTKEQMLEDFDFLYDRIKTVSPQMEIRKKVTGTDILAEIYSLRQYIDTVPSEGDFYDIINKALFLCQDPHTSLAFRYLHAYTDTAFVQQAMQASNKWLNKYYKYGYDQKTPFLYIRGKYYTFEMRDKEDRLLLPAGARILKINDIPVDRYVATCNRYVQNNTRWDFKYKKYFSLDINDPRVAGAADRYVVTYSYRGKKKTADLAFHKFPPAPRKGAFDFKVYFFERDGILYIRIPAMDNSRSSFLQEEIAKYKGKEIKKVIVDVRGNGGGNDGVWEGVLSAITDKPLLLPTDLCYKNIPLFRQYFSDDEITAITVGRDSLFSFNADRIVEPSVHSVGYAGPVYVLVDFSCFSSSLALAAVCNRSDRLVSVGIPSGYMGGRGLMPRYHILPHSKIIFRLAITLDASRVRKNHPEDFYHGKIEIPVIPDLQFYLQRYFYPGEFYGEDYLYQLDPVFKKVVKL